MCPGHRAVAPTPPECPAASAALRRSMLPSPSGCRLGLRVFALSGPPLRSLALRPGDSPTIPKMAVSMGFRPVGFPPACHPSYGVSALPPAGLTPAEHISLFWTHNRTCGSPASGSPVGGLTSKEDWRTSMGRGPVPQPLLETRGNAPRVGPRVEGRQQPCRPLRRCEPRHVCAARSGAGSPYAGCGQFHQVLFRRLGLHASTSLHPFAPPALPGFDATMGALTPARRLFVS
jgi:hypothetical protein